MDKEKLVHRFQELELFAFIKLIDSVPGASITSNFPKVEKHYSIVRNQRELEKLVEELSRKTLVAFDLETTSLEPHDAKIVGLSFSWEADQGVYVAVQFPEAGGDD
ncbi:MAG: hypothetical protein CO167_11935, partial [Candidatus Marinimicrobia bacterium CG_4_9_14_3_um_filter_48_9]